MAVSLQNRIAFANRVKEICGVVADEASSQESLVTALNGFQQPVFIKNAERVLVVTNKAFDDFFAEGSGAGRHANSFLHPSFRAASNLTDELILSGSDEIDCVHNGVANDGFAYLCLIHKRSLAWLGRPGFRIIGVIQPMERLEASSPRFQLRRLATVYRRLDPKDQDLCRLVVLGRSSSEIGDELGMTGRNVEIRRKKAFESLGVKKPVDLARLLVQLQERGELDLGL
ncbi:MAG: hypothetical protein AAGJ46_03210 [Planctomycetota bacterium]